LNGIQSVKRFEKNVKTLCRMHGLAQDLIVTRKGPILTLWSAAGVRHTVLDTRSPHLPGLEYARNMLAALAFCPGAQSCLVLGLGGGSVPRMLLKASPQMEVEAVEIDPAIVELAEKYFDIYALPRCRIYLEDAVVFLRRCSARYAIVVVDTYLGEQFPDPCATREFIVDARKCLLDDGVLVVNWLSGDRRKRDTLLKTIEESVGPVWQLPGLQSGNVLYLAAAGNVTRSAILSAAGDIQTRIPFENSLARLVQRLKIVSG
jgi:spermidine synthase